METSIAATAFIGTQCPHCAVVLQHLNTLIKDGELAKLTVINLHASDPSTARDYNIRSVPVVRIGDHELAGSQTLEAFKQRINWVKENDIWLGKFDFMLSHGEAFEVSQTIKNDETKMQFIMQLLSDPATVLSTRIGIGVVMEEFSASTLLRSLIPALSDLLAHDDSRIRADAAHYLSLTESKEALPALLNRDNETNTEVKEVIEDSIQTLNQG